MTIEYRKIGLLPNNVSVIGMGCWAIGGKDWGYQSDSDSIDALKAAFNMGINHFDTAQVYGKGHSEELIGKALHTVRSELFIASKMMYTAPEKVENLLKQSLQRLKTDYIDLFYIHWPRKNGNLAAMMEKLVALREKGYIRGIGVSNFSVEQMKEVMTVGRIDAHQMCYNLLWRFPEKQLIPFCIDNAIAVIPYSTIAQGILVGKFDRELNFDSDDHRKGTVLFEKETWPDVYNGVQEFKRIASEAGHTLLECAIQWTLERPGIQSVLVGARNSLQIKQNAEAIKNKIDKGILDKLTDASEIINRKIPDTGNIFRWYP